MRGNTMSNIKNVLIPLVLGVVAIGIIYTHQTGKVLPLISGPRATLVEDPSFDSLEVIVDTKASVENIQRLLSNFKGISYAVEEGEDFKVNISREPG